ncbi:MAG: GNAT family N-acetyltransferase [Roseiflexaceae bacterium]|nr:GNAT family N-acetyltransferase [Roseiflexaceae bacterium]
MVILETERLLMRRFQISDLDALFALYRDPMLRQFFPDGTLTYQETREELEWFLHGHPQHPKLGLWATIYKPTESFIGRCGLLPWTINQRQEVEISYLLDKAYWGQGLATEAAQALLRYGYDQLQLTRLICLIHPHNHASINVAHKVGMTLDYVHEDEKWRDLVYAHTR